MRFDDDYYRSTIQAHGYSDLDFADFRQPTVPGTLPVSMLRRWWLCHHDAQGFIDRPADPSTMVTTGLGMSGPPHAGTLSQILRTVALQRQGCNVQMVLGDLDAHNSRPISLSSIRRLTHQYRVFIVRLGFDLRRGVLRNQYDELDVLRESFLLAQYLSEQDFARAAEDTSESYRAAGVVPRSRYSVGTAITLMLADFLTLYRTHAASSVIVMLGLEEHRYVLLAREVASRSGLTFNLGGLYSRVVPGLRGFPKMSKSVPGSGLDVSSSRDEILEALLSEPSGLAPDASGALQMMIAVSDYDDVRTEEMMRLHAAGGAPWREACEEYAVRLFDLFSLWPREWDG